MKTLKEIKENNNLNINLNKIEKEIDFYFDNISKKDLIKDLKEVGIEVKKLK